MKMRNYISSQSYCFSRVRVALTEDGVPMSTLREIALLKSLDAFKHPNIVKYALEPQFRNLLQFFCSLSRILFRSQIIYFLVDFNSLIFIFFFFNLSFRLLDVCHGQLERDRQLVLFLVFEHLEEDLAGYLSRIGAVGMPARTIQVPQRIIFFSLHFILNVRSFF